MDREQGQFGAASPELRELVRAVCEETLTAQQRDHLEQLLRSDEAARLFYIAHVDMTARIQFMFRGQLNSQEQAAAEGQMDAERQARVGRSAVPLSILGGAGTWIATRSFATWLLLAIVLVGGALVTYVRWGNEEIASQPRQKAQTSPWVAALDLAVDVEWDGPAPPIPNPVYLAGSELRMKKGLAKISFSCGAMMLLEGPAVLQFESDLSVVLRSGKMSAEVPEEATGFTVRTPRANIIDLGTAFGASVDDRGRTEVQVFKGKVDTEVRDLSGHASRFYQLSEGESLNIGDAKEAVVALSTNPQAFPRLPALNPEEYWGLWQVYRNRTLQDKDLVAYWSFDDKDARDLSPNHNDGFPMNSPTYTSDVPPLLGGGLCLDVSAGPKFVQVPHSKSLDIGEALTIAFWVRGGNQQQDWARVISKGGMMNCSGWVIHRACDLNQIRMVVGNQTHCNQSIANVSGIYDNTWHHLAIALNRGSWQVYLDGAFHSHGTYNHGQGLANKAELIIGAAGEDQMMVGSLDFEGQIDELCIFRRALSADEIRRICPVGELKIHRRVAQR